MQELSQRQVSISVKREPDALDLPLPAYATDGAAALDLYANVQGQVTIMPGERLLVSTGLRIALPKGYEAQIRPRSGLAIKHGVTLVNSPGTIDEDFRGVIQAILINHGSEPFTLMRGDRMAQLVAAPVSRVSWIEAENLDETNRGSGGFGSTGLQGVKNGE